LESPGGSGLETSHLKAYVEEPGHKEGDELHHKEGAIAKARTKGPYRGGKPSRGEGPTSGRAQRTETPCFKNLKPGEMGTEKTENRNYWKPKAESKWKR